MATSSKIPWIAAVIAFLMAGLSILVALTGQIVLLPFALIPLIAGVGIVRKRVWSAYGFALFLLAQLLLAVILGLLRSGSIAGGLRGILPSATVMVVPIALFFFAGRSLAIAGSRRGWASPWIGVSVLVTVPLLFFQPFVIPTGAMEDTILIGDRILVRRFPRPSVTRGDIIVFPYPVDPRQTFVKRVVGVPGDHIKISGKIVYRNGVSLIEPYAVHKTDYVDSYRDNFPSEPNAPLPNAAQVMLKKNVVNSEIVVPEGKYFFLGDNRDSSLDSRYWGFVGAADLIGKPVLVYSSEDPSTGPHRIRWDRLFKLL
jgi:signal peptidase I